MSFLVRRTNSSIWWFKMDVPRRHRAAVGKTAWWISLGTADRLTAEAAVGGRSERHKRLIAELERLEAGKARLVTTFIDQAFAASAEQHGSKDRAVVHDLVFLTMHVAGSWRMKRMLAGVGRHLEDDQLIASGLTQRAAGFDEEIEHQAFELRARLIEGRGIADGLVYQEVAKRLLARGELEMAYPFVVRLASLVPDVHDLVTRSYDDVARAYLGRLAEHAFESWPEGVLDALATFGQPASASTSPAASTVPEPLPAPVKHQGLRAMRLTEALAYWQEHRSPGASAITEATRAVDRFVALFGDLPYGDIDRDLVMKFRNCIMDLPPQTELAKVKASGRTLMCVIEEHRAEYAKWKASDRQAPEPGCLAPGTVKKDITGLSQVLGKIASDLGELFHAGSKVEVSGYSKTKKGQKRPRLSFTPAMMQKLFDSPMFTGCAGKGDVQRTRRGNQLHQDELYWPSCSA